MEFTKVANTIYSISVKYSFDPEYPSPTEEFIHQLVEGYNGNVNGFAAWFENNCKILYLCYSKRPEWIQNPEWPLINGKPGYFIGQIDAGANSYYVFYDRETGETKTIVQTE